MHNLANLWPFFLVFLDFCQEIISHSKISASWTRFSLEVFVNFSCHFRFFSQYSTFLESARAFCSFDSSLILRTPSSDFTIPLSPPTITCRYGQRSGIYFQSLQKLNLSDLSNLVTIPSCSTHLISPPLQQWLRLQACFLNAVVGGCMPTVPLYLPPGPSTPVQRTREPRNPLSSARQHCDHRIVVACCPVTETMGPHTGAHG